MQKDMKNRLLLSLILLVFCLSGCSDYLDIVPDGVARLETAFNRRTEAKKFFIYMLFVYA